MISSILIVVMFVQLKSVVCVCVCVLVVVVVSSLVIGGLKSVLLSFQRTGELKVKGAAAHLYN